MSQPASQNDRNFWPVLDKNSVETCSPELRRTLAYVHHLRTFWRLEEGSKLVVPSSWMEFISPNHTGRKCGVQCTRAQDCPFRRVRFESNVETRFGASGERMTREATSQLFSDLGRSKNAKIPSLVARAFDGVPYSSCKLRSQGPIADSLSQNTQPLEFALVRSQDGYDTEQTPRNERTPNYLLLGIQGPARSQQSSPSKALALTPTLEDLAHHSRFHLSLLATQIRRGASLTIRESFPEWLVLFGFIYEAEHLHITVHLPRSSYEEQKSLECVSYVVDELTLCSPATHIVGCELLLERLRVILALSTLRRHVFQLTKSLFGTPGPCRTIGHEDDRGFHSDQFQPVRCNSPCSSGDYSSDYSTCYSSVHGDDFECTVERCSWHHSSSRKSSVSSFCSTCSSLSGSLGASDSASSEHSECTNSEGSNFMYMEPSAMSGEGGGRTAFYPKELMETRRREIIAWAQGVVPTEHPVKDTYRMIICHDSHPRRQKQVELKSITWR